MAGRDFEAKTETADFFAGVTGNLIEVRVPTFNDRIIEIDETMHLVLSEATENGDGVPVSFTVSLSEASGREVSVPYATVDASAEAGHDYVAAAPDAMVTVPAGDTAAERRGRDGESRQR